jgi:hypothetical protein
MYNKILNQINKKIKIKTLGGRSSFWVEKIGNKFQIINSSNNIYPVDSSLFQLVFQRYKALNIEDRFKASQYTDPNWVNCPNRVASVYIAALIKYFEDDETEILVEINEPPKPPIIKHSKNLPYDCEVPEYLIKNKNRIITSPPQNINLITSKYSNAKFMEFEIIRKFFKTFPDLKKKSIQRADVSELFRKKQYYLGFITAMIWGGINASRPKKKDDFETIDFYKLLKQDEKKITTIIHHVKSLLVKEEYFNCFNYLKKEGKINGVGHAYFTKLMYFIGYVDKRIKIKPLIFDKWTSNAYLALLINSNQIDNVKKLYTVKIDNKSKIVSLRSNTALTYENYIKDMNCWAYKLGVSPSRLEEYIFGVSLKENRRYDNPRKELWKIINNHFKN